MPDDASLAGLFKEFGDRWQIEHMEASARGVAVRRDGDDLRIIGAHDLSALRYRIETAERENAGTGDDQ